MHDFITKRVKTKIKRHTPGAAVSLGAALNQNYIKPKYPWLKAQAAPSTASTGRDLFDLNFFPPQILGVWRL